MALACTAAIGVPLATLAYTPGRPLALQTLGEAQGRCEVNGIQSPKAPPSFFEYLRTFHGKYQPTIQDYSITWEDPQVRNRGVDSWRHLFIPIRGIW